jgi:hypothetical protein
MLHRSMRKAVHRHGPDQGAMMRRCARRPDRLGRKPPPVGAGKRSSAAEAADNGEQDPEHRTLFPDLGFLPHDCDKNAELATTAPHPGHKAKKPRRKARRAHQNYTLRRKRY